MNLHYNLVVHKAGVVDVNVLLVFAIVFLLRITPQHATQFRYEPCDPHQHRPPRALQACSASCGPFRGWQ